MFRDDPHQLEMPVAQPMQAVDFALVAKQSSMSKALALCQSLSGLDDAWSRIMGPSKHNFPHDKLNVFMDIAGNEAPLLWLAYSRGYDLHSMHKRESETERENRLLKEENAALRRVLMGAK